MKYKIIEDPYGPDWVSDMIDPEESIKEIEVEYNPEYLMLILEDQKNKITHLEGEISSMMEIMGSYVDGINLLNERILSLEEQLK